MFKRASCENEVAEAMAANLKLNQRENRHAFDKLAGVIDSLASAAEVFDAAGCASEADALTNLIGSFADKKTATFQDFSLPEKDRLFFDSLEKEVREDLKAKHDLRKFPEEVRKLRMAKEVADELAKRNPKPALLPRGKQLPESSFPQDEIIEMEPFDPEEHELLQEVEKATGPVYDEGKEKQHQLQEYLAKGYAADDDSVVSQLLSGLRKQAQKGPLDDQEWMYHEPDEKYDESGNLLMRPDNDERAFPEAVDGLPFKPQYHDYYNPDPDKEPIAEDLPPVQMPIPQGKSKHKHVSFDDATHKPSVQYQAEMGEGLGDERDEDEPLPSGGTQKSFKLPEERRFKHPDEDDEDASDVSMHSAKVPTSKSSFVDSMRAKYAQTSPTREPVSFERTKPTSSPVVKVPEQTIVGDPNDQPHIFNDDPEQWELGFGMGSGYPWDWSQEQQEYDERQQRGQQVAPPVMKMQEQVIQGKPPSKPTAPNKPSSPVKSSLDILRAKYASPKKKV